MPSFNIVRKSKFESTFRTESIKGQFDLQIKDVEEQFIGNIQIESKSWQIGCIVGSSGTGKTTIAREVFNMNTAMHEFTDRAVIDEMPEHCTVQEIAKTFNSVGFATVWSWLKPYHVLSNGEKMRVDLAYQLLSHNETIIFDEFTSVVDRTIAKTVSYAVSKAIRKSEKKFIAVTCHHDILDWLEPDWVYDTDQQRFFFAKEDTNDQNFSLTSESVMFKYGISLKSITI